MDDDDSFDFEDQFIETSGSGSSDGGLTDITFTLLGEPEDKGVALDARQHVVYSTIVETLRKEIQPELDRLANESAKYRAMKRLYRLPSISELRDELNSLNREAYLDFDENKLKRLVITKDMEAQSCSTPRVVRRFNRRSFTEPPLEPIVEETADVSREEQNDSEKSGSKGADGSEGADGSISGPRVPSVSVSFQSATFKSALPNYVRSQDGRPISVVSSAELKYILSQIEASSFPEIGRIGRLIFRFDSAVCVNRLSNSKLSKHIKETLQGRGDVF